MSSLRFLNGGIGITYSAISLFANLISVFLSLVYSDLSTKAYAVFDELTLIVFMLPHPRNAVKSRLVRLYPIESSSREVQFSKAFFSIAVTLEPSCNFVSDVQPLNAS